MCEREKGGGGYADLFQESEEVAFVAILRHYELVTAAHWGTAIHGA